MIRNRQNRILKMFVFFMLFIAIISLTSKDVIEGEVNEKIAYITFDDGPSKYTSKILDILDENNVKGTFFMLKNIFFIL